MVINYNNEYGNHTLRVKLNLCADVISELILSKAQIISIKDIAC